MLKTFIFFITLSGLLLSCKRETEVFKITGKEYINEAVGRVRTYKVDSIYFSENADFGKDTTVTFYQRHITKNIFKDSSGADYFYHQVYNSFNKIDWFSFMTYKSYVDSSTFIKQEDNKKVIHLNLPINYNNIWDGNIFNQDKGQNKFRYVDGDDLLTPDSIYQNQIIVRLKKEILPVTESFAHFETYAPNIGMVYKYKFYQEVQLKNIGGVYKISGVHVHYNLIDYQ